MEQKSALEELKESCNNMGIKELIEYLRDEKDKLEVYGNLKKSQQALVDAIAKHIVPERMEEEGLSQITIEGVGRVNIRSDIYCSTPKINSEAVKAWLIEHGFQDLISEVVNGGTMKAFVKEQMVKPGGQYPEELLNITPYDLAVITKT